MDIRKFLLSILRPDSRKFRKKKYIKKSICDGESRPTEIYSEHYSLRIFDVLREDFVADQCNQFVCNY